MIFFFLLKLTDSPMTCLARTCQRIQCFSRSVQDDDVMTYEVHLQAFPVHYSTAQHTNYSECPVIPGISCMFCFDDELAHTDRCCDVLTPVTDSRWQHVPVNHGSEAGAAASTDVTADPGPPKDGASNRRPRRPEDTKGSQDWHFLKAMY